MKRLIYLKLALIFLLGVTFSSCDDDDPAVCNSIAINGGNEQAGSSGNDLPAPLQVRVTDASGNPVANAPVRWEVIGGGGTLSTMSSTTNSEGLAETIWKFGQDNGRVKASIDNPSGCSNNSVEFKAETITLSLVEASTKIDPIGVNADKECFEFNYVIGYASNADLSNYFIEVRGEYQFESDPAIDIYDMIGTLSPDRRSITFTDCFAFLQYGHIDDWFIVKLYNKADFTNGELREGAVPVITSNKIGPIRTMKPEGSPRFASGASNTGKRTPSRR